jgi:hypothetical protein
MQALAVAGCDRGSSRSRIVHPFVSLRGFRRYRLMTNPVIICPSCAASIDRSWRYCIHCGVSLRQAFEGSHGRSEQEAAAQESSAPNVMDWLFGILSGLVLLCLMWKWDPSLAYGAFIVGSLVWWVNSRLRREKRLLEEERQAKLRKEEEERQAMLRRQEQAKLRKEEEERQAQLRIGEEKQRLEEMQHRILEEQRQAEAQALKFLADNQRYVKSFLDLTYLKISRTDEYGDEQWELLGDELDNFLKNKLRTHSHKVRELLNQQYKDYHAERNCRRVDVAEVSSMEGIEFGTLRRRFLEEVGMGDSDNDARIE